jgi:tRNA(adenine34) deaminase
VEADERWMRLALELAALAEAQGEVPVGAVVVVNDEVVGRGYNHPIAACDPTLHAEIDALRDAARKLNNYRLTGAALYSTVEPCIMCLGACLHARIGRLVYAAPDPKVGAIAALEQLRESGGVFNHRLETLGGVLAEEASNLVRGFFAKRRDALHDG